METGYSMYAQAVISLGFVIGLILITAKIMKAYIDPAATSNKKRISISEAINLDGKNRVLLVRRDDIEHLVIVGTSNLLIEQGIPAPPPASNDDETEKKINK
jgi:flagellar protein FliO/FliZ